MPLSSVDSSRPAVDIRRLQRIFDRRAQTFDAVSFLPREVAQRMRERLECVNLTPTRILDAGCGLGDDLLALQAYFDSAQIYGLDVSHQMLARALAATGAPRLGWRGRLADTLSRKIQFKSPRGRKLMQIFQPRPRQTVQADFATLPFAASTFDLCWSNLALHWHPRPEQVLLEWQRVLKTGGLLMFSLLGPDSLCELRAAGQRAGAQMPSSRVLDFTDMHDLGDMLVASGFEIPVMEMEKLTITYSSPAALLSDVRRWGAYPFNLAQRPAGLTGRGWHEALMTALEAQRRADGTLSLTFEIIYGHAWKAAARTTAEGYAIVRLDEITKAAKQKS
ncbi:methyltransferase domain-containing protein [Mycoavidus sp. HKI]|uniref:methyltransferase domain-containing protein n=1 Tax=Mycoavidus sp. HKI TaxID=2840467 RepID=UPI001CBBF134|nr:methyltransferase domain-containing protein [Mycoavidus sp. HKI]UAW64004.1 methyltransferase domain-containing protein [Mycoavidus sp. HKI]